MAIKTSKPTPKTTVRIWSPVSRAFKRKIDAACLRRDAYLTRVLEWEISCLDKEIPIPNSQEGYKYVSGQLEQLRDRELLSLALPSELTKRINDVCREKRIVRDAFFNRLFLLLGASTKIIDKLFFGLDADKWQKYVWKEKIDDRNPIPSILYPLNSDIDPFYGIRCGLEMYSEDVEQEEHKLETGEVIRITRNVTGTIMPIDGVYTTYLDQKFIGGDLIGMNCYMPDWRIPGSTAEQVYKKSLDELFEPLEPLPDVIWETAS